MKNNISQGTPPKQPTPLQKRWLNTDQAAEYLGCSRNFLDKNRLTRIRQIPFTRLGRVIRYDVFDLDAYLEAAKVTAAN